MELEVLREEITPWVKTALDKENIRDCEVVVTGKSEKGENYAGDVVFAKVSYSQGKQLNLVIKMGKKNKVMREKFTIKEIYLREVRVYDKILPAFLDFQTSRKIKRPFNCVPKCYSTLVLEETEVLIFENLQDRGFEMHDRQVTFNRPHLQIVLKKYAELHAISFAMKDQDKSRFEALTVDYTCIPEITFLQPLMEGWFVTRVAAVLQVLGEEGDEELVRRAEEFFKPGGYNMMKEVVQEVPEEVVITHGDCWNSNFMFKYQDEAKQVPTDITILDWQLSSLHSPVLDLTYFLSIVCSGEELSKLDELLRFYHGHLSEFLRELGSDPDKLFPYSTLKAHWIKYSPFGILFAVNALEMMMCDKEDAISMDDFTDDIEKDMAKFINGIKPKQESTYRKRMVGVIRAYLKTREELAV